MWRTAVLTVGLLMVPAHETAADGITVVVQYSADFADAPTERSFRLDKGQTLIVDDIEYGGSVEGALVTIRDPTGAWSQCRIQTQYETSVSIADEGPHLDLLDWVHFTSEWVDAKKTKRKWSRVPTLSDAERTRFPEIPAWELYEAVLSRGGPGWAELVKNVQTPHDPPAGVDVSVIRVRALCGAGSAVDVIATLEFLIPMGC